VYWTLTVVLDPDGKDAAVNTVVVLPLGNTTVTDTFCAVLGPLLTTVTTPVIVCPGVPFEGTAIVTDRSAIALIAKESVLVLFVLVRSGVLVETVDVPNTPALTGTFTINV
jgi:hypothetical protein